jgi:hypothetical protein
MAAVFGSAAEPLDEEALLCPSPTCQIPAKKGAQRGVIFDSVVEAIDEHPDRRGTTAARKEIAANEGAMSIGVSQEPAVFHSLTHQDGSGSFKSLAGITSMFA